MAPGPDACSDEYPNLLSASKINDIAIEFSISGIPSPLSYRIPNPTERASSPSREGEIAVYHEALIAGLRLPLPQLFVDILRDFDLCPSQLAPNSWRCLCEFVIVCLHCGIEPTVDRFKSYFGLRREKATNWCFFGARYNRRFHDPVPSSLKGWKSKYFFVSSPEGFPFRTQWGSPKFQSMEKREFDKLYEYSDLRVDHYLTSKILQASGLYLILDKRPVDPRAVAGSLLSSIRAKEARLKTTKLEKRKRKEDPPPLSRRNALKRSLDLLYRRIETEILKRESTPVMRLLNDLLNLHDGFDDDGWLKKCRKCMVVTFPREDPFSMLVPAGFDVDTHQGRIGLPPEDDDVILRADFIREVDELLREVRAEQNNELLPQGFDAESVAIRLKQQEKKRTIHQVEALLELAVTLTW